MAHAPGQLAHCTAGPGTHPPVCCPRRSITANATRAPRLQVWSFFSYSDIGGSPWDLKSPPNCEDRWNNGDACSKRKSIESMPPLPGNPDNHPLEVRGGSQCSRMG